jgi:pyruvate,water dikinase
MQINPPPSLEMLGGKAFHLYKLREICRVPPFFVLSFDSSDEIGDAAVQESILLQWKRSGYGSVAVRSSASVEDSPSTSFAGIFESVLGVSDENLIDAIEQVRNSLDSERLRIYCKAHGFSPDNIRMNVIIQKLISSRVSGVCFSKMHEEQNKLIVEACFGMGEALVSGRVTPDTYFVDRKTLTIGSERIGYQSTWLPPNTAGKPSYQEVPFFRRTAKKLTESEIMEVAQTSLTIESRLGLFPADIEWAFEERDLFVLQARRFTGIPS